MYLVTLLNSFTHSSEFCVRGEGTFRVMAFANKDRFISSNLNSSNFSTHTSPSSSCLNVNLLVQCYIEMKRMEQNVFPIFLILGESIQSITTKCDVRFKDFVCVCVYFC